MSAEGYCVRHASTLDSAPRERAEFWTERARPHQCLLEYCFRDVQDFGGGTTGKRGERFQLVEFWSDGIAFRRSRRRIARDGGTQMRLVLPLNGRLAVRLGDDEAWLERGDAALLAGGSPCELRHRDVARGLILTLPDAKALPARSRIDLRSGLGAVLGVLVTGLAAQRDRLGGDEFETVCTQVRELVGMLAAPEAVLSRLEQVEQAFRAHVAARADHPGLTGASAAAELGWSLRQVQFALQRSGTTPREVIRDERLRRANRRLRDPALRHMSIAQIAFASGFTSMSTFGEAFRRRYGMAPRDLLVSMFSATTSNGN